MAIYLCYAAYKSGKTFAFRYIRAENAIKARQKLASILKWQKPLENIEKDYEVYSGLTYYNRGRGGRSCIVSEAAIAAVPNGVKVIYA